MTTPTTIRIFRMRDHQSIGFNSKKIRSSVVEVVFRDKVQRFLRRIEVLIIGVENSLTTVIHTHLFVRLVIFVFFVQEFVCYSKRQKKVDTILRPVGCFSLFSDIRPPIRYTSGAGFLWSVIVVVIRIFSAFCAPAVDFSGRCPSWW